MPKEYAASTAQQLHIATSLVILTALLLSGGFGVLAAAMTLGSIMERRDPNLRLLRPLRSGAVCLLNILLMIKIMLCWKCAPACRSVFQGNSSRYLVYG